MTETTDHIRRLAELYLTAPDAQESAVHPHPRPFVPSVASPAIVELVVVGHLPVRAGLWLTQYADDVAREEGPTGLIRLDADQMILEVLRGDESAAKASAAATLREAVEMAAPGVRRWIIRAAPAADPASLLEATSDVITILSGADEIAVVGAYRAVKELHDAAAVTGRGLPRIELAVLGADRRAADEAADRIALTASTHLGIDITLRRCVRAMGALGSTLHFRFPSEHAPSLIDLANVIRKPPTRSAPHAATSTPSTPGLQETAPLDSIRDRLRSISTTTPGADAFGLPKIGQPPAASQPPAADHPPHPSPAPPSSDHPMRLRPKLNVHVEAKPAAAAPRPQRAAFTGPPPRALASWVDGLAKLDVSCPYAADVEIAVDTHGQLHLLAWEDRLRALFIAETWTRKNGSLIARACPEHAILSDSGPTDETGSWTSRLAPVLHLFASEPSKLIDLHGGPILLHLLAPVDAPGDGKTGWYSAAL
jgi:hypothetical protein